MARSNGEVNRIYLYVFPAMIVLQALAATLAILGS